MDEIRYVRLCLKLIEQKLGWADRGSWVYDDFRKLQEMILETSGISLSVHTLERLFGKLKTHKNYNPQKETKNALAVFLGFENWKHFKAENSQKPAYPDLWDGHGNHLSARADRSPKFAFASSFSNKKLMFAAVAILLILISYLVMNVNHAKDVTPDVNFTSSNVFGVRPHTVKFSFDLSGVEANDISIHFGTGKPIHNIPKDHTHIFKTYLGPGIYEVQLKADGKPIATKSVFIAMRDWKGYVYSVYEDTETRKPIPDSLLSTNSQLYTPPRLLKGLVDPDVQFFVEYLKVDDFKVNGDNMSFETRFQNNHKFDYQICFDMWFKLIGTDGVLKMHFLKSGCAGFVQMIFGEKHLNGHKQDLSVMTREFQDWSKARMEVKNKRVDIYFDNELIYSTSYEQSVGKIHAVAITSKGSGQTDYIRFYNDKNQLVYSDDLGEDSTLKAMKD